jgi:hypothetical protein
MLGLFLFFFAAVGFLAGYLLGRRRSLMAAQIVIAVTVIYQLWEGARSVVSASGHVSFRPALLGLTALVLLLVGGRLRARVTSRRRLSR